ncbi:hypothetical protein T265_14529, partial [Opisthorchis viverrini]
LLKICRQPTTSFALFGAHQLKDCVDEISLHGKTFSPVPLIDEQVWKRMSTLWGICGGRPTSFRTTTRRVETIPESSNNDLAMKHESRNQKLS